MTDPGARYARQTRFSGIGEQGQRRLARATAVVIGLGSLGAIAAELLARAGLARLRLVDRDFVELPNLSRQTLYEEKDARLALPKAVAARNRLQRINRRVTYEAVVADFSPPNAEEIVRGAGVVIDGTDNFEARYLLNETCVKLGLPWVYGACAGSEGFTFTIRPGHGPCLRCFILNPPAPGVALTCEMAGIIGPAAAAIGALEAGQALRVLVAGKERAGKAGAGKAGTGEAGSGEDGTARVLWVEAWGQEAHSFELRRTPDCPCCAGGDFPYLDGKAGTEFTVLCGRDMVQVTPKVPGRIRLDDLAAGLAAAGRVTRNQFLVRAVVGGTEMVVFSDGRALIKGTSDPQAARNLYARYPGA